MTEELLLCQCGDPAHQLIMFYDDDVEAPAVYVSVHLSPEPNFFKRLWRGIKYVFFKKRSIYGDFDEIILRPSDAEKLQRAADLLEGMNKNIEIPVFIDPNMLPS
jgi:outer membrane protein OmpA-like peptidoglycan-associated protein